MKAPSLALALVLALLPRPTLARPGESEFQEAVIRYSLAKFQQSVKLLRKARRKARDPELKGRIELYLGLNSAVMGQTQRARAAFKKALTLNPAVQLDATRTKASIVTLFTEVQRGMLGTLTVSADRPGVHVLVDGKSVGQEPGSFKARVGRHTVEVRDASRVFSYKETVTIAVGKETKVSARLVQVAERVTIESSPPGASILIGGKKMSLTPTSLALPLGEVKLTLKLQGYKPAVHTLRLKAGESKHLKVKLDPLGAAARVTPEPPPVPPSPPDRPPEPPRKQGSRLWTWVAVGGAAVALGVAIGLGVSADADFDAYNDPATDEARSLELQDSVEGKALGANVLFGVAGALAVTAAVLFFVEGRSEARATNAAAAYKRSRVVLFPGVGDGPGIGLRARF